MLYIITGGLKISQETIPWYVANGKWGFFSSFDSAVLVISRDFPVLTLKAGFYNISLFVLEVHLQRTNYNIVTSSDHELSSAIGYKFRHFLGIRQ